MGFILRYWLTFKIYNICTQKEMPTGCMQLDCSAAGQLAESEEESEVTR